MKPCKRGIKIWCRCDLHNGYLSQFEIYIGKDEAPPTGGRSNTSCTGFRSTCCQKSYLFSSWEKLLFYGALNTPQTNFVRSKEDENMAARELRGNKHQQTQGN